MHIFDTKNYLNYLLKNTRYSLTQKLINTRDFISEFIWFSRDYYKYKKLLKKSDVLSKLFFYPQLKDKTETHGFDAHYVYQGVWAFERIMAKKPDQHIDVGSQYEFLGYLNTITNVTFIDIRPVKSDFSRIKFKYGSILELPFPDNSVSSLSCMHVAEHIGLGRYGDPLDPEGTIKAVEELQRVMAPGGYLYFSIPTGRPKTYFNAHRVLSPDEIISHFKQMSLIELSAVLDNQHLQINVDKNILASARYACGLYLFQKKFNE